MPNVHLGVFVFPTNSHIINRKYIAINVTKEPELALGMTFYLVFQ